MDLRKIVKEEVSKVLLNEFRIPFGDSFVSVPTTFDHLKWKLNHNQKHYLGDLCSVDPNSLSESDYKNASKFLGIPEKSVKSIINTYSSYSTMSETHGDSEEARNSRLTFGNKAATAFDIGIEDNATKGPIRSSAQINNNPPTMSKPRMKYELEKDMLDRRLYRAEKGEEHPVKARERFFENLNTSLMMYLYCESNPKDINLREDGKIQLDFESIISENEFNQFTGGYNYETEKYKSIKKLLDEFNDRFGCSYVIYDHVNINDTQRLYIEHNVTEQVDMSEDSVAMMKKFLLPKVITGHKIQTNDPSVAALMGLNAGDTSWLEGPIGGPMQSGVLSRIHQGRA